MWAKVFKKNIFSKSTYAESPFHFFFFFYWNLCTNGRWEVLSTTKNFVSFSSIFKMIFISLFILIILYWYPWNVWTTLSTPPPPPDSTSAVLRGNETVVKLKKVLSNGSSTPPPYTQRKCGGVEGQVTH